MQSSSVPNNRKSTRIKFKIFIKVLLLTSKRNKIQFAKYSTLMLRIDIEFSKEIYFINKYLSNFSITY
jgi:hypothetical protein